MIASPDSPTPAAERQARYRARHALRTVEVSAATHAVLAALRIRLSLAADQVIARALAGLAAELDRDVVPAPMATPNRDMPPKPTRKRRGRATAPQLHPSLPF